VYVALSKEGVSRKTVIWAVPEGRVVGETDTGTEDGACAFSPDSSLLAVPKSNRVVALWNPRTGKELARLHKLSPAASPQLPDETVISRFSPDASCLAVAEKGRIEVFQIGTAERVRTNVFRMLVGFVSNRELVVHDFKRIYRWDFGTGEETVLTPAKLVPLAISADCHAAVMCPTAPEESAEHIRVLDLASGKELARVPVSGIKGLACRLSPNGRRLALQHPAEIACLRLYDVKAGRFEKSLVQPGIALRPLGPPVGAGEFRVSTIDAVSPGTKYAADFNSQASLCSMCDASGRAGSPNLTIWDTSTGRKVTMLASHQWPTWSSDGCLLATMKKNLRGEQVTVWEVVHAHPAFWLTDQPIRHLAFSRDGQRLAVNGQLWSVRRSANQVMLEPVPDKGQGNYLTFGPEGRIMAACFPDDNDPMGTLQRVRFWRSQPNPELLFEFPAGSLQSACFSSDGRRLFVVSSLRSFGQPRPETQAAIYDVDSKTQLAVWNDTKIEPLRTSWSEGNSVFSPDGKRIVAARGHQGLAVWDAANLKLLREYQPAFPEAEVPRKNQIRYVQTSVEKIIYSPDGRFLISGGFNGAWISDPETGHTLDHWLGANRKVLPLTPDGRTLASSGGWWRTVTLWDPAGHHIIAEWEAHESEVTALAFSPDGGVLSSGSSLGEIRFWNLPHLRRELAEVELDWPR
jgi:WD40 repeat protein